ncbi:hypothetical protein EDB85DRAFT_2027582, partial [Lactarius pseudohatsudake]
SSTPDHRIQSILIVLLKNVRRAYNALHEGTDSAFSASTTDDGNVLFLLSSYPLCNIPGHRPRPSSHARIALSNTTAMTLAPPHLLLPLSRITTLLFLLFLFPAVLMWLPPKFLVRTSSTSHHIPATSPDTATAGGTRQGIDSSTRTVPRSSGSTLTLQHDAGSRASSDAPDCPSSPSPTPFVDTMIHMSTFSSSDLPQLDPTALTGSFSRNLIPSCQPPLLSPLLLILLHSRRMFLIRVPLPKEKTVRRPLARGHGHT